MQTRTFNQIRDRATRALKRLDMRPVALHRGNLVQGNSREDGRPVPCGEVGQLPDLWYIEACEEWAAIPRRRAV